MDIHTKQVGPRHTSQLALENRIYVDAYGEEGYILINCTVEGAKELHRLLGERLDELGESHA